MQIMSFAHVLSCNQMFTGKMKPISIGQCINGVFAHPALTYFKVNLPKVPKTMNACTFNLCARVAEPFVNDDGCRTGLEISVVNILKSVMAFKVTLLSFLINFGLMCVFVC